MWKFSYFARDDEKYKFINYHYDVMGIQVRENFIFCKKFVNFKEFLKNYVNMNVTSSQLTTVFKRLQFFLRFYCFDVEIQRNPSRFDRNELTFLHMRDKSFER